MFEKEIRFIHDICMNQINRLGSFVTFEELTGTELHPAILKYISAEIDLMILEDRQKLLDQSNFDYTGEEMTDAFRQVGQIIKNSKKFPIDYISNLILLAISFNMNYLIHPRRTLTDFIYQNENILNANFVKYMLNYTYYYSYIRKVFDKYSVKKALLTVPKSDFETILSRLDQEMFDSHTNRIMDTALNSIADFFNIGSLNKSKIPLTAIEPFLLEKNLENYLDRLRSAFPAVTKFSYSIPDVQRVMYSTTPIKRENYLDKTANKKIQDSVLGIEENVVTPKEEVKWNTNTEKPVEVVSNPEFQEAEFTLIPENEEKDTISRLRSKNVKVEIKESEPVHEEIKPKEPLKQERQEPENKQNNSDIKQREKSAPEKVELPKKKDELIKEKRPVITDETIINKKAETVDTGLLEDEETELLDLYDREIKKEDTKISDPEGNNTKDEDSEVEENSFNQEDDSIEEDEVVNNNLPEQDIVSTEAPVEEEEIDSDEDEFIVVGEELSVPGEKLYTVDSVNPNDSKTVDPIPNLAAKANSIQPDIKQELKSADNKPAEYSNPKFENVRKRRIFVKKFKPSNGKDTTRSVEPADEPQDEGDQKKIIDENIPEPSQTPTVPETPAEVSIDNEEQSELKGGDIFSCLTEKELQRILKGVFNDDAEDFALTLDTMSACNNYDEAVKLLRSLFRSYKIKRKSKEAVILKKAISQYYRRSNDIDLI